MKNLIFLAVTLVIAFSSCKKKQQSIDYTSKMGGTRIWHGVYSYINATSSGSNQVTDTFAVNIINNSTISAQGYTLNFLSEDMSEAAYVFETNNNIFPSNVILTYYYIVDSMQYQFYQQTTAGYNRETLSTP